MRILIISDSHGNNEPIDELIRVQDNIDLYIHAGDAECQEFEIYPFRTVKGNCDFYFDMQEQIIIPSPFGNILVRHKPDLKPEKLKELEIKTYVYGHTHVKECVKRNGICYLNPGAISYPRDEQSSYVILEDNEKEMFATFFDLETNKKLKKYRIYVKEENK